MLRTWSVAMVPPLFSAMNSRRSDDGYPKVASRANSVSPAGTLAADCCPVDVAGGEPAGLEIRRYQQHPVEATAADPRRALSMAAISAMT